MTTPTGDSLPLDRDLIARRLLAVLLGFSVIALALEYDTGNTPIVLMALAMITLAPVVLWLSRKHRYRTLPRRFLLVSFTIMLVAGNLTQLHRPPNLVWLAIFPFAFFYLGSLRTGLALTALGLLSLIVSYLAYGQFQAVAPVDFHHFAQVASAYVLCTLLAFLYERENARHRAHLQEQASRDFLTNLPDRRGFMAAAPLIASQMQRLGQPCALIVYDIDDFKIVNDTHGHARGDQLLTEIAALIHERLRASDLQARWGGEEFVALLPNTGLDTAVHLAEELRARLATHTFAGLARVTASFGVALQHVGEPIETLIERADQCLYRAKQAGKNRVEH